MCVMFTFTTLSASVSTLSPVRHRQLSLPCCSCLHLEQSAAPHHSTAIITDDPETTLKFSGFFTLIPKHFNCLTVFWGGFDSCNELSAAIFCYSVSVLLLLERCNPWPHVANRHIFISQLLSLWRHSHYDILRLWRSQPPFSLWRHSHYDVIRYWAGHAHCYGCTNVRTPYRV